MPRTTRTADERGVDRRLEGCQKGKIVSILRARFVPAVEQELLRDRETADTSGADLAGCECAGCVLEVNAGTVTLKSDPLVVEVNRMDVHPACARRPHLNAQREPVSLSLVAECGERRHAALVVFTVDREVEVAMFPRLASYQKVDAPSACYPVPDLVRIQRIQDVHDLFEQHVASLGSPHAAMSRICDERPPDPVRQSEWGQRLLRHSSQVAKPTGGCPTGSNPSSSPSDGTSILAAQ